MKLVADLLNWESIENTLIQTVAHHPLKEKIRALAANEALILVRNWYGQLMLLLPCARDELDRSACGPLLHDLATIVGSLALHPWVLCRDDLFDADSYWSDPSLISLFKEDSSGQSLELLLLERQDKERDWLIPSSLDTNTSRSAKRCVFFSVKGGVGRSSALTMLAIALAQHGKRVLVVDGDFESPGISSSLLPAGEGQPDFGIVDWLTAQSLGADEESLEKMALTLVVEPSPLNALLALKGQVLVAPAYGRLTEAYVSKLARVYRQNLDGKTYSQRLGKFLSTAEIQHKIDITLFDCRAGIDDTAGAAITQLQADVSLLFAINTTQTWDSYRLLFQHLRRNAALFARTTGAKETNGDCWDLRRSLRIVSALTPQEHGAHTGYFDNFRQNAYDTFTEIYDEDLGDDPQAFAPAPDDTEAPHSPSRVMWVEALRAFSPLTQPSQVTDLVTQAAFADFIGHVTALLENDA